MAATVHYPRDLVDRADFETQAAIYTAYHRVNVRFMIRTLDPMSQPLLDGEMLRYQRGREVEEKYAHRD